MFFPKVTNITEGIPDPCQSQTSTTFLSKFCRYQIAQLNLSLSKYIGILVTAHASFLHVSYRLYATPS